jgi:hypothetical protein
MNAEQEQQIVTSLNQIASSLEYLTRYAFQICNHLQIVQPTPPKPLPAVTPPAQSWGRR